MKRQFDAACRQYEAKTAQGDGLAEWTDGLKSGFPSVNLLGKTMQAANPAPDAPQGVMANNATVRSCGKNLFNPESTFFISGSVTERYRLPKYENGVFYTGGQSGHYNGVMICFPVEPGEVYTCSYEVVVGEVANGGAVGFSDRGDDGIGIGVGTVITSMQKQSPFTFTIPEGVRYIGVNPAFGNTRYEVGLRNIQLERGAVATAYEPYFDGGEATAPHLMCAADGTRQSTYDPQTGTLVNWWWDKITFDGSADERWSAASFLGNTFCGFRMPNILPESVPNSNAYWCNQTVPNERWNDQLSGNSPMICYGFNDGNSIYALNFGIYNPDLQDKGLANWKAHLTEHPLEVWVARNEPEITNIGSKRLICPTGFGQIMQVVGDIPNCPVEVQYLAHGGNVK